MNSDASSPRDDPVFTYDSKHRLCEVRQVTEADGSVMATYLWGAEPRNPSFTFEHDQQKRIFVLTWPDGKTEHFRDNPVRHLMVEPDPLTGEMLPVIKRGQPAYLYLSREEREL